MPDILKIMEAYLDTEEFLDNIYSEDNVIPKREDVFKALTFCRPKDIKVIIIGQDPYPNPEDAMGMAFSVPHRKIPPSLRNIFKELKTDIGCKIPKSGDLTSWAKQGVLLLNSILTVKAGKSLSHEGKGWEERTTKFIQKVLDTGNPIVILAWGKYAQNKLKDLKTHDKVLTIFGGHPSPLNKTYAFRNQNYFSKANDWLIKHDVKPIFWHLDP